MAALKSVTLRAYDVGFGDCFLLSFKYAQAQKHILIDFGSTRLPSGKTGTGPYLERIARQIETDCGGKLTAVVATHRHKDHISGFATSGKNADKGPGAIIRGLRPDLVLQPWTEHPDAAPDATKAPKRLKGVRLQRQLFLRSLHDMNRYAGHVRVQSKTLRGSGLKPLREQLDFLGDDNELANRAAVVNLMTMGRLKARYLNCGAPSGLEPLLPGVKVHVLGPPTLEQDARIETQTDTQKDEFWHLRASFWARRAALDTGGEARAAPLFPKQLLRRPPWDARWFAYQSQRELAESMLSIVRTLDDAMNNTSLILLFEIGDTCLLFPGDAQWENWRYALGQEKYRKLLSRVTVYKVGHHGSLNATPKSMWKELSHRGGKSKPNRLLSMLSTRDDVHGSKDAGTEVPRKLLVDALKKETTLIDTRDSDPDDLRVTHDLALN
ncbi:MAG: hypothetical protein U0Q55_00025 [Vicinamibacterales bacterium]